MPDRSFRTPSIRLQLLAAARRDPWLFASRLGAIVCLGLIACFGADAGMTLDEPLQVEYGERALAWFRSGFVDRSAFTFGNLYLYGGLFDVPAQLLCRVSPLGVYETRHLLTALLALLGAGVTWKMAALLAGPRAGFLAAALLLLTPVWTGHGLFNPKDIPFGTAAAWVVYECMRILVTSHGFTGTAAVRAGLALGVALGVRPGGMFLIGYCALSVLLRCGLDARALLSTAQSGKWVHLLGVTLLRAGASLGLAWLIMLATWPWAQVEPFARPLQAAAAASQFPWRGLVLFKGSQISALELPADYLPVWFAITLPELYAVALVAGLVTLARNFGVLRRTRLVLGFALLWCSVCVPIAAVIVKHAVVYDAQRHVLFVLPPLAAGAGVALAGFLHDLRGARPLGYAALLAGAALIVFDMARLHPYEYVYFNRSFGGLPAAAGRFETDYWGASYLEGLAWLDQHVIPARGKKLRVRWCNDVLPLEYYLPRWPGAKERLQLSTKRRFRADYYLGTTRNSCGNPPGPLLHRVQRDGVTLLYVSRIAQP